MRPLRRSKKGSQIVEFAAALLLLVTVVLVPFLDLAIVPVRWMLAKELINDYVRTLAMGESFSQSLKIMESDSSLKTRLLELGGVGVKAISLRLKITRVSRYPSTDDTIEVSQPGHIPKAWLPDGALAPCVYLLKLDVQASIAPAILMKWHRMPIPGLTVPIPVSLAAAHEWTNLGRDPSTETYFINE